MNRHGDDEQDQDRCVGERTKCDPVEQGRDRNDDGEGQRDADPHRKIAPGGQPNQSCRDAGEHGVKQQRLRQAVHLAAARQPIGFHHRRDRGKGKHQPDRARHLPQLQRRDRECRIADHIAERHKDDARHQEDENDTESDEHIDRPGGNSILSQKEGDLRRHCEGAGGSRAARSVGGCPRSCAARGHICIALAIALPAQGISVHAPFCSWTSTRARSSTPKELPALKL